jgi:hypothetical protein
VYHIAKLIVSWSLFVLGAKEIRTSYNLALWWIHFGLNLTTDTVEGKTLQTLVTSISLTVWKTLGQTLTINFLQETFREHRKIIIKEAKENLRRAQVASSIHGYMLLKAGFKLKR